MNKFPAVLLFLALLPLCGLTAQKDMYDMQHIVDIKVSFQEVNWHNRLDSYKESGLEDRLVATVTVDGKAYEGVGIRYKGNSSYFNVRNDGSRKLPLNIKINYTDKALRLPGGYTTLKLSNVFRDPSFLREALGYEIAGKYLPAPRANFAKVTVNGQYLGLYNLTESVDDDLLDNFFGDEDGILVKCDPNWHDQTSPSRCLEGNNASLQYLGPDSLCYLPKYELKSKYGWKPFIEFIRVLNQVPDKVPEMLDVNETLWMMAFNNVTVNLDSYLGRLCHNYYLYQDQYKVWHPVLWDLNLCFGGFRYADASAPLSNTAMQEMSMFLHHKENNAQRPLVLFLLRDNHYRKIYLAHVRTIVEENFSNGWYKTRAEEIRKLIAPEVAKDTAKLYSTDDFNLNFTQTVRIDNQSIIGLTELMDTRATALLQHPLLQKSQPVISTQKYTVKGKMASVSVTTADANAVWVYYRNAAYQPWQRVAASTGDTPGQWTADIALEGNLQYYIVAENDYVAALSPRRAGRDVHTVQQQ